MCISIPVPENITNYLSNLTQTNTQTSPPTTNENTPNEISNNRNRNLITKIIEYLTNQADLPTAIAIPSTIPTLITDEENNTMRTERQNLAHPQRCLENERINQLTQNDMRLAKSCILSLTSCCIGSTICALPCTGSAEIGSLFFSAGTCICILPRIFPLNQQEEIRNRESEIRAQITIAESRVNQHVREARCNLETSSRENPVIIDEPNRC